jgi:hypothetical protein
LLEPVEAGAILQTNVDQRQIIWLLCESIVGLGAPGGGVDLQSLAP